MGWLDWSERNIVERFKNAKEEFGVDDLPAALLVLADSIERAGWNIGMTDSDGQLNVRVSGEIESKQPLSAGEPRPMRKKAKKRKKK